MDIKKCKNSKNLNIPCWNASANTNKITCVLISPEDTKIASFPHK